MPEAYGIIGIVERMKFDFLKGRCKMRFLEKRMCPFRAQKLFKKVFSALEIQSIRIKNVHNSSKSAQSEFSEKNLSEFLEKLLSFPKKLIYFGILRLRSRSEIDFSLVLDAQ